MDNKSLSHAGVKGMRWGVRRYQNKDGSLTDAGKKRYYREADAAGYKQEGYNGRRFKTSKKGKVQGFDADPDKWVTDDLTNSRKLVDESSNMTGKLKKLTDDSIKHQPKVKMDLSKMSDQQMRSEINRALLERQYNDMFAPQKSTKGREYASQILETAGDVLAVAGSAVGIALSIKALKKGL